MAVSNKRPSTQDGNERQAPEPSPCSFQQKLGEELQDYLALLSAAHPFSLEVDVAADPLQISEVLAIHIPVVHGWEDKAIQFSSRVVELVAPLIDNRPEGHVRISIKAGMRPWFSRPTPGAAVVYIAFDAGEGCIRQTFASAKVPFGLETWTPMDLGVVLMCQPSPGIGEARAVGTGAGEVVLPERGVNRAEYTLPEPYRDLSRMSTAIGGQPGPQSGPESGPQSGPPPSRPMATKNSAVQIPSVRLHSEESAAIGEVPKPWRNKAISTL